MRDTYRSSFPSGGVGRFFTLLLVPRAGAVFGPAWAVLCGALASGRWRWERDALLGFVLTLFIVEVLWSTWRALLIDLDWEAAPPMPERGDPMPSLPYVMPRSPLGRFLRWAGRVRRWVREELPPERRGALLSLIAIPFAVLLLSALVNRQVLILSFAALALIGLEWRCARGTSAPRAVVEIALGWVGGHLSMGELSWASPVMACCYALSYQGAFSLGRNYALPFIVGGQAAAATLLFTRGTTGAVIVSLLIVPQLLLATQLTEIGVREWYLRRIAPFVALSMAVAAWTL